MSHSKAVQGSRYHRFAMFHSGNKFPIQEMKDMLDLTCFECTQDSHGNHFTIFTTREQKRVNQIIRVLKEFNEACPGKAIQIDSGLGLDPPIVTFGFDSNYKKHHIVRKIKEASEAKQAGQDVQYISWKSDIKKKIIDGGGSHHSLDFDVVKKRRAMEAPGAAEEVNNPEALAAFEEFEMSVLPALEQIRASDDDDRRQELLNLEVSIARGVAIPPSGGVYFAWSSCLKCMKIGATRRGDPQIRLRELSQYVTVPFTLTAWLPTPTPFRLEADVHKHFEEKRINTKGSGAGTEFFRIGKKEVVESLPYLSSRLQ